MRILRAAGKIAVATPKAYKWKVPALHALVWSEDDGVYAQVLELDPLVVGDRVDAVVESLREGIPMFLTTAVSTQEKYDLLVKRIEELKESERWQEYLGVLYSAESVGRPVEEPTKPTRGEAYAIRMNVSEIPGIRRG